MTRYHKNFKYFLQDEVDPKNLPLDQKIAYSFVTSPKESFKWLLAGIIIAAAILVGIMFALPMTVMPWIFIFIGIPAIIATVAIIEKLDNDSHALIHKIRGAGISTFENEQQFKDEYVKYEKKYEERNNFYLIQSPTILPLKEDAINLS
jgi:hypothetical protein